MDDEIFEIDPYPFTKHALILGATGSGKTVLAKVIVEEAVLHGIPVLAIDPKGDIGNLAFASKTFAFSKWCRKEADALGKKREEYSRELQRLYKEKTLEFNDDLTVVENLVDRVKVRVYTPKSSYGLSMGISPDLSAPKSFDSLLQQDFATASALLDLTAYSLLRLAGFEEKDREPITFVSAILEELWKKGESTTIQDLIKLIQEPPFNHVGSLPLSKVISDKERNFLAMRTNLLIADPKLRPWLSTDPVDFDALFSTEDGKTPVNVVDLRSIQSENEKHLFLELLLQRLFQWILKQGSTQTLRYLLYFDEIAGYCPPVKEPPSKKLLLLLVKQARAFGLGLLLASQNAIDLDYKIISNANIRMIGRLGARRDIDRIKVGLELESSAEKAISSLKVGEFYCNIFEPRVRSVINVRWPLAYHRGPLEDAEIAELMASLKEGSRNPVIRTLRKDLTHPELTHPLAETLPEGAYGDKIFLELHRKFTPDNLQTFMPSKNLKSLKILSCEHKEEPHPIFKLELSVSDNVLSKEKFTKSIEVAEYNNQLVSVPPEHKPTRSREIPTDKYAHELQFWKPNLQTLLDNAQDDLDGKILLAIRARKEERIDGKCAPFFTRITNLDRKRVALEDNFNAYADTINLYEKKYQRASKILRNEKKSAKAKAHLLSMQNRIDNKKAMLLDARRKLEQLQVDKKDIEDKIQLIHDAERRRADETFANRKLKQHMEISGWLIEIAYDAKIMVNNNTERPVNVEWNSFRGTGKWGNCVTCSAELQESFCCNCGNLMCKDHMAYCKICSEPICDEHKALCNKCESVFCPAHSSTCEICKSDSCLQHIAMCSICSRKICSNCHERKWTGFMKREPVCIRCKTKKQV
ncbi:MAG: DUF853 family protein [Thaumarchaeota archaeon]|nr:DUF853 family protein [Nitrososphaerota archaeon]